jgi:hypothetical protein
LKDEQAEEKINPKVLLVSGKEFLNQIQEEEVNFSLIGKPRVILTNTKLDDLPIEVQNLLNEYVDIVVDDLPNEFPPI